jgi:hypothetical protein
MDYKPLIDPERGQDDPELRRRTRLEENCHCIAIMVLVIVYVVVIVFVAYLLSIPIAYFSDRFMVGYDIAQYVAQCKADPPDEIACWRVSMIRRAMYDYS